MTKGQRIKQKRELLGLAQIDVANKIHVSKQTLYKYENDIITNIPSDKIELLANTLDVTPEYIMGWEEIPTLKKNLTSNTALTIAKLTKDIEAVNYVNKLLSLSERDKMVVYSVIDSMLANHKPIPDLKPQQNQE